MRLVACLLAGLFIVTVLPPTAVAVDDCASATVGAAPGCVTVPITAAGKTYYIYYAWAQCPLNPGCQGRPPAHLVGVIWQETNNAPGLQRSAGEVVGFPADTPVLY